VLSDGGLMLQWIGHPPEQQYKLILRSFLEVFPHTTLWAESFLVGSTRPVRVSESAFERFRGERPELRAALQDVGISDFDSLLALYDAGPDQLRRFAGVGPLLTDDRPLVEYYRSLEGSSAPPDLTALGPPDASALRTP
jgi:spermidine synthase